MALQRLQALLEIFDDTSDTKTTTIELHDQNQQNEENKLDTTQNDENIDEHIEFLTMTKGRKYVAELIVYGYCRPDLLSINSILYIITDFFNIDEKTELKDYIKARMWYIGIDPNPGYRYRYFPFKNIEELHEHNFQQIDKLNPKMIHKLLMLKSLIQDGVGEDNKCRNMDKESMVPFRTSGFCFNKKGDLIIFNER